MGLETATHINDLNSANPLGSDAKAQGDDHIRLVKDVLKRDLPLTTPATALGISLLTSSTPQTSRDLIGATTSSYRNKIINGDASVSQRDASSTIVANGFSPIPIFASRFFATCAGANATIELVAKGIRIIGATSLSSVKVATTVYSLDATSFQNQPTTLSASIKTNGTPVTVTWAVYRPYGNSDVYDSNRILLTTGTFAATSTLQKFAATFTPTLSELGLQIVFSVGAMASGVNIELTEMQLEKGSISAANITFEEVNYKDQFSRCLFFYKRFSGFDGLAVLGSGHQNSTTVSRITLPIEQMRKKPDILFLGGVFLDIAGALTAATFGTSYSTSKSVAFDVNHAAVGAAAGAAMLQLSSGAANYIEIDAEIKPYL